MVPVSLLYALSSTYASFWPPISHTELFIVPHLPLQVPLLERVSIFIHIHLKDQDLSTREGEYVMILSNVPFCWDSKCRVL
jgi:hypothetical protein